MSFLNSIAFWGVMAGIGVAVAHADEALKSAADYVTDSSTQAVAEAIEQFVLK